MPDIKAVLFDFDGVLFDPRRIMLESHQRAFKQRGYNVPRRSALEPLLNLSPLKVICEITGKKDHALYRRYCRNYEILLKRKDFLNFYPGYAATVRFLDEIGIRLGIASSQQRSRLWKTLSMSGTKGLYGCILSWEDSRGQGLKSRVRRIKIGLERLKVETANCLCVGDTRDDILGARMAGVRSVGALYGLGSKDEILAANPEYSISRLRQVCKLVSNLRKR